MLWSPKTPPPQCGGSQMGAVDPMLNLVPYSPAVRVQASADLLFVSGQLPVDPEVGDIVLTDIVDQTRQALLNALAVVRNAGASPDDVVKVTLFVRDLDRYAEINQVYVGIFGQSRPARTTVEVARLPKDALVEVEVIASVPAMAGRQ